MGFIKPEKVVSPQKTWHLDFVLYDEGEGGFSVSCGRWDNEKVVGLRWNGSNTSGSSLGNPQSSGYPTWFIVPKVLGIAIVKELLLKNVIGNENIRDNVITKHIDWLKDFGCIDDSIYK